MPILFNTKGEGGLIVINQCPKCGKFLKFKDCNVYFNKEAHRWEIDGSTKAEGNCPRCGKVDLDFYFD